MRAVVDFIARHKNLTGGTTFHTWSGVLLRPFEHLPDEEMHAEDLWVYQAVGKKGTELTGYPNISVYHEFRYHPKDVIGGTFDWIYEHLGVFSWVVEIWSPMREAGIADYKYIDWFRDHTIDDDLKLIRWSDEKLGGIGHIPWKRFEHPQLGPVDIGGWNRFHAFSNPPPAFLEKELERFPKWLVWQALISPKLALVHAGAERVAERATRGVEGHAGRAERRLAAFLRQQARAGAQGRARSGRRGRACPKVRSLRPASCATSTASSKARRTSTPAFRSGRITTSPTIG